MDIWSFKLTHIFLFILFLLSFGFDWEDISNTQNSVWPNLQTPWRSSKMLCCVSFFQLSSRCLEMWSKAVFRVWYITSMCLEVWLNTFTLLMWLIDFSVKKCPELPCHELFYAAKISLFFLAFSYLRFAGICEKRTKQDQRKVENILASNQQSEVENDFREFFDSSREDARDVIQSLYGSEEEIDIHVYYPIIACIILEVSYIRFHHLAILLNILPLKILNILSQGWESR